MRRLLLALVPTVLAGCSCAATPAVKPLAVAVVDKPDEPRPAPAADAPFRLPADAVGDRLGELLRPTAKPYRADADRPTDRTAARMTIRTPLPTVVSSPLPLPSAKAKAILQPRLVAVETLDDALSEPVLPGKVAFAVEPLIRTPRVDASLPPPVPVLAQRTIDRVSLEDATATASTTAVLAAPPLLRTNPAPYQKTTVPEPFEHRRPFLLRLPGESESPQTGTPQIARP
jgi:hypothetical protein